MKEQAATGVRERRRRALFRQTELTSFLAGADGVAAVAGASLPPIIWSAIDPTYVPTAGLPVWQFAFAVVWFTVLRMFGGGDLLRPRLGRRSIRAVSSTLVTMLALILIGFYFFPFIAPRGSSLTSLPVAALATLGLRFMYLRVVSSPLLDRRLAVIGADAAAQRAALALVTADETIAYTLVAFVVPQADVTTILDIPVVSATHGLWETLQTLDVDLVVVGHTKALPASFLNELVRCFEHGVEAVPATTLYEELTGRVMVAALEADWYAELPTRVTGLYAPTKRLSDIVVALLGVITVPLAALIALAIMLDSGRPVLIHQVRVGRRGERFVLHKFRTMRANAEDEGKPLWATQDDPRRTSVGRVLRKLHLDELPQLWDVLRGRMSLIGPRPERPEFVESLANELPLYHARELVRPGITGWAQVLYPYAGSLEENLAKLEYDLYYIRHFGPVLDFSIVLRTIGTVLGLTVPERRTSDLAGPLDQAGLKERSRAI